ncbi:MAG: hypothetical protein JNK04_05840 [Myxococcales bacterium]|nr:hypothetical protein [Myxococcales bacterium]
MTSRLTVLAVLFSLLAAACPEAQGRKNDGDGEGSAGASKKSAAVPVPPPKLAANAVVLDHLKKLGEACTVNIASAQAYQCKGREDETLREWVATNKPKDLWETLASVVQNGDEKARAVAIAQLNGTYARMDNDLRKGNATRGVSTALLDALEKNDQHAFALARPATYAATLAGDNERRVRVTDALTNKDAKKQVYRSMMTHGRLELFPEIQKAAKTDELVVAALASPRELHKWTDAERSAVCPWAKGFLGDAKQEVAAEAGYLAVKCKGDLVDALLDEGDRRLAAKDFKNPFAMVFREICFEFMSGVTGQAGLDAQCKRNFAFLEKVANDESVDSKVRGMSLWNIYYQRRNQESLDLMRKYEKHKDPEIQKRAKEAIDSLTTTYKLK